MNKKGSGILLHITSLPSRYGIGDLGPEAYKFADFLCRTKQSFWQILPLNPAEIRLGNCPYSSISAFAGNINLISPDLLLKEGLLSQKDIEFRPIFLKDYCDFENAILYKKRILSVAYNNFLRQKDRSEFEEFCDENFYWLDNFSLFKVLKLKSLGRPWYKWSEEFKNITEDGLEEIEVKYRKDIEKEKFLQFLFHKQWLALKKYCNARGIKIIGDIPFYVNYDSVDVWSNPEIFKLDIDYNPVFVSGVPPDYFSKTGQRWGNPVYAWNKLKETKYAWWIDRIRHNISLFDMVRIDHFRGFVAYWEIPAEEKTAINGKWVRAEAEDFFNTVIREIPKASIIAEDLGYITDDVRSIIDKFGFPGMRILLFAFGEDNPRHPYLPQNYIENCVAYTGTHDNNTIRGWFEDDIDEKTRERLFFYLGGEVRNSEISWILIRRIMHSKANIVIIPAQDLLGLGSTARMNIPAKTRNNWRWELFSRQLDSKHENLLLEVTKSSQRGI